MVLLSTLYTTPSLLHVPSITLAFSMTRVATVSDDKFRRSSHHLRVVFKRFVKWDHKVVVGLIRLFLSVNKIDDVRVKKHRGAFA